MVLNGGAALAREVAQEGAGCGTAALEKAATGTPAMEKASGAILLFFEKL